MTSLIHLATDALANGWAVSSGSIQDVVAEARVLGWRSSPVRRGAPDVATLRPVSVQDAHPRSLSAMVGLDQQPFHTDGAHIRQMPDIVVLAAVGRSETPTLLVDPGIPTEHQLQGVFKVSDGRTAFYATAADAENRWRYDPGCMTPADDQARIAAQELEGLAALACRHEWSETNMVLVIANRRVLHARAAATDPATRKVQRAAFVTGLES